VVHATGTPAIVPDEAAMRGMVMRLVGEHEAPLGHPWDVSRAEGVMDVELRGIVGFEIPISRIEGKFKLNQNRAREDQEGVALALEGSADPGAREIARMMRARLGNPAGDSNV
jgi:transcriptional regulator